MPKNYQIIEDPTSRAEETLAVYPSSLTSQSTSLYERESQKEHQDSKLHFQRLFAEWERNVGPYSNTNRLKGDPAFLEIVSMGREAIPYLYAMLMDGNFAAVFFCEEIFKTRLLPPERFSFKAIVDDTYPSSKELIELWLSHLNRL